MKKVVAVEQGDEHVAAEQRSGRGGLGLGTLPVNGSVLTIVAQAVDQLISDDIAPRRKCHEPGFANRVLGRNGLRNETIGQRPPGQVGNDTACDRAFAPGDVSGAGEHVVVEFEGGAQGGQRK